MKIVCVIQGKKKTDVKIFYFFWKYLEVIYEDSNVCTKSGTLQDQGQLFTSILLEVNARQFT